MLVDDGSPSQKGLRFRGRAQVCASCGKTFYKRPDSSKIYCSPRCRERAKKARLRERYFTEGRCLDCGDKLPDDSRYAVCDNCRKKRRKRRAGRKNPKTDKLQRLLSFTELPEAEQQEILSEEDPELLIKALDRIANQLLRDQAKSIKLIDTLVDEEDLEKIEKILKEKLDSI